MDWSIAGNPITVNHHYYNSKMWVILVLLPRASSPVSEVLGLHPAGRDVCVSRFFLVVLLSPDSMCCSANLFAESSYFYKVIPARFLVEISSCCKISNILHGRFSVIRELVAVVFVHCYALRIPSSFSSNFPVSISSRLVLSLVEALFHRLLLSKETKKTLTSLFCFFWHNTVCLSVPMRELYWNSSLCEFLIAIHWWRLSRKGQIRTQSTRAATRRARPKTDFTIRSEKQFIWTLLQLTCIYFCATLLFCL